MEQPYSTMENMGLDTEFWKNKKVLITGQTGFKGSWLSLWLNLLGSKVIGYSLAPPTVPSLFDISGIGKTIVSVLGDVRDYKKLKETISKFEPEIIIHMAAQPLVRKSYTDPIETYQINVMGTVNLLESIRNTDFVKVLLNITTDKCYQNKEWEWGYREIEPLGGFDPYSSSKACSEIITSSFRDSFFSDGSIGNQTVSIASARAGNVVGGGDWAEDRLIPDCIKSWINHETVSIRYPDAIRPWQHVLEPLNGYMLLIENLYKKGNEFAEAWNFGPNEDDARPVGYVVKELAKYWGPDAKLMVDSKHHPHEANYLKLDCSKAKSRLGWVPKWKLEYTLGKTAEWYECFVKKPETMRKKTEEQILEYSEN